MMMFKAFITAVAGLTVLVLGVYLSWRSQEEPEEATFENPEGYGRYHMRGFLALMAGTALLSWAFYMVAR